MELSANFCISIVNNVHLLVLCEHNCNSYLKKRFTGYIFEIREKRLFDKNEDIENLKRTEVIVFLIIYFTSISLASSSDKVLQFLL